VVWSSGEFLLVIIVHIFSEDSIETVNDRFTGGDTTDFGEAFAIANWGELVARIQVTPHPRQVFPLDHLSISMASKVASVFICVVTRQPTIILQQASMMKHA